MLETFLWSTDEGQPINLINNSVLSNGENGSWLLKMHLLTGALDGFMVKLLLKALSTISLSTKIK